MSQNEPEFWARARRARDKLVDQFIYHPDVNLIDIGYAPERNQRTEEIVLRIHVKEHRLQAKPEEQVAFPDQVDGIPVVMMLGEYRLDTEAPEVDEDQAAEK